MLRTDWKADLNERIKKACGNNHIIYGKALGPAPRFFIIGDAPVLKDTITGTPFSGALMPVLASAIQTIHESDGANDRDCYITYLRKSVQNSRDIDRDEINDLWIPILQQEFIVSGCTNVVGIGKVARMFTGEVCMRPAHMPDIKPGWWDKVKDCYKILSS